MTKWVYSFSAGKAEGSAAMRGLLGGKGANLAEMAAAGLPVPPGFTLTTDVCAFFYANGRQLPADLEPQVDAAMAEIGRVAAPGLPEPSALAQACLQIAGSAETYAAFSSAALAAAVRRSMA